MNVRGAWGAILLAGALLAFASKAESVSELIARAEAARPEDRAVLYIEIAELQLKAADELYTAGKVQEAQAAIGDVAAYSEKAHDASLKSGKRLKNTEIAVRKMADKLRDIKRTLNFDDQAPVQEVVDRLEQLRTDLLAHMFGKGK